MKLALLNTSIITNEGAYEYRTIGLDNAKSLLGFSDGYVSHVGHDSTAAIMSELLGICVPMSRVPFVQAPQQRALVFKLNGRPPEGKILSRDEIEAIGGTWGILERTDVPFVEGIDYEVFQGSFGRTIKKAVRQGLTANRDRVLYSVRPDLRTVEIPMHNDGRFAIVKWLGELWAKEVPNQTELGITLDREGEIGVDTIELCHFS